MYLHMNICVNTDVYVHLYIGTHVWNVVSIVPRHSNVWERDRLCNAPLDGTSALVYTCTTIKVTRSCDNYIISTLSSKRLTCEHHVSPNTHTQSVSSHDQRHGVAYAYKECGNEDDMWCALPHVHA